MRVWIILIVLISLFTAGGGWIWHNSSRSTIEYRTAPVRRGDIVSSISATGTLEPEEEVDIGAQVAGQVESFGKDVKGNQIDYRSEVEPNMLLAKIDDTVYKADADVAEAQLNQANTAVLKAKADVLQANSKLLEAQHNWDRARTLGPSDALSQNDYDMYQADFETAKANVAVAESEVEQANDGVPLAKAELYKAKRNVDYCTITSPVKGVIIDRRVNVGQTVVSSLSTPSLFLIAKDLSKLQIWVSVNEADIGKIVPGGPVTFTCDTFPNQVFDARVGKVRWNPTMNQNVVLYTVEVNVDNSKKVLIPFLTAKVQFEVARDSDSLIVPNLALRWVPGSSKQVAPDARAEFEKRMVEEPAMAIQHGKGKAEPHGTLWIKDGDFVRPVDVKLGVTDRVDTAVVAENLKEGDEIVTGDIDTSAGATEKNPFMPPMQQRRH